MHWQNKAACRGTNPETFVDHAADAAANGRRMSKAEVKLATRAAMAVCAVCPVRAACLDAAMAERDKWAIRGGLTVAQRTTLARRAYPKSA
ncbi:WhiB family transcriptional regulator [Embleya sp. NBC_00896]|uniref:WhiB family transcriptional regulator n=1 Tax=Embleya sp. NBC_00896 TaxID=2975961 RepID=UPI00386E0E75|nr:WhiB family transcriptional regulator [Embleya sp. NBC_00896]